MSILIQGCLREVDYELITKLSYLRCFVCGFFLDIDCLILLQSPETVLFDALKRLQLMPISVKILKVGNASTTVGFLMLISVSV